MEYQLRDARIEDLDKVIELCEKHAEYEQAAYQKEGKKERLQVALFAEPKMLNCIVAEMNNKVVGYATYTFDYSTWDAARFIYLDCLYLEEHVRSYGIGQGLMDKVISIGKENNCINMQWQTPDFNERAIKFYKRIGGIEKDKLRFTLSLQL